MEPITILNQPQNTEVVVTDDMISEDEATLTSTLLANLGTLHQLTIGGQRTSLGAVTYQTVNGSGILSLTNGGTFKAGTILFITHR